ncbi:HlyD family secretion protein [Novipirellula artificiosorum]|uniref:Multidrug resistance protein MdtN n=1 Tax=Novipirellula artificiosorum TaxID=2528016 RepID=A0A5C6DL06_9BACT|nr:HlyD family secretion protein [Novipirellula artificiosorum]TWU37458.1 Multidrug resistance protein MdtN [Novipirellula artificiosorum]
MLSKDSIKKLIPKLVTTTVVVAASACAYLLYSRYQCAPWTRDGQVRADVVQIAPRVNGYLVKISVKDNQAVSKGDLLFQIDPSQYQLAVDQAEVSLIQAKQSVAQLEAAVRAAKAGVKQSEAAAISAKSQIDAAQAGVESANASVAEAESGVTSATAKIAQVKAQLAEAQREAERAQKLADSKAGSVQTAQAKAASVQAYQAEVDSANAGLAQAKSAVVQAQAAVREAKANLVIAENGLAEAEAGVLTANADLDQAKANLGEPGDANYRIQSANVQLEQAQLNLNWTSIYAPADGYISNMSLLGDTFVSAGTPFALFVDSSSFRVDAYFQETKLKHIQPGDEAIITLMSHHNQPLKAHVESIGYAINPPNLAQTDGPSNIVPTIQPTFEWIRLAQRVPVRIRFDNIPKDIHLVSGMTASIAIRK